LASWDLAIASRRETPAWWSEAMSDEQRWTLITMFGGLLRQIAKMSVKYKVPKHVLIEVISEDYDEARDDARQP
jgi:hypothetical protein